MKKKKVFFKNLIYAFSAQIISLLLSFIMSLIVPKILGVDKYSYWQLFLFYSSYVGFTTFGFSDGIYLRLGGKNYEDLDFRIIGSQIKLNMILQVFIVMIFWIIINIFVYDQSRKFVLILTSIFLIISNFCTYIGYVFQAVNKTNIFSIATIIEKVFFLVVVLILLFLKIDNFKPFIILYVIGKTLALIYCVKKGKKIIFSQLCDIRLSLIEMWKNISIGIKLMIANISSMLILGSGRFIIDKTWGITAFGKFSFALSLCTFFLQFINQTSMVLFPALRKGNEENLNKFYGFARSLLSLGLPAIFLIYTPMSYILSLWLPEYQVSLRYLAYLLPLCIYDGKMNLLCNTYFKVLRKENILLNVNFLSVIVSFAFGIIGANIFNNIYFVVFSMVFSIAFRSIISELYLAKLMKTNINIELIMETIMVVIFIITVTYMNCLNAFIVFLIVYTIYIIINTKKVKDVWEFIKNF